MTWMTDKNTHCGGKDMTLVTKEYSQGVCEDGAAILCDGERMTIEDILAALRNVEQAQRIKEL